MTSVKGRLQGYADEARAMRSRKAVIKAISAKDLMVKGFKPFTNKRESN